MLWDRRDPDLHSLRYGLYRKHGWDGNLHRLRCHWPALLWDRRDPDLHSLRSGLQCERWCRWRGRNAHLRSLWSHRQWLLPG